MFFKAAFVALISLQPSVTLKSSVGGITNRHRHQLRLSGWKVHEGQGGKELAGPPLSPILPQGDSKVLMRYIFEGGKLARDARLITLTPRERGVVTSAEVQEALSRDGVSLEDFFATAYESEESSGAWVRLDDKDGKNIVFPIPKIDPEAQDQFNHGNDVESIGVYGQQHHRRPRLDVKLFRRQTPAAKGALEHKGFFAIGIVGAKTTQNIGSLWRSAYQLGASYIFTVGARYTKTQATDTLVAHKRMPCFEFLNWPTFIQASKKVVSRQVQDRDQDQDGQVSVAATPARGGMEYGCPRGAQLIAVEMGGEPLETFVHPERAVYILGSEDTGLPDSVVASANHHVALPAVRYESYNVAMAGSIVLYDRLAKQEQQRLQKEDRKRILKYENNEQGGSERRPCRGSGDIRATDENYDTTI